MTRMMALTFTDHVRGELEEEKHFHESPLVMTLPLMVLAVLSVVGGVIGLPGVTHMPNLIHDFLNPVFSGDEALGHPGGAYGTEILLMVVSTGVAITGIYLGWIFYVKRTDFPGLAAVRFTILYRLIANKYYVDEIYQRLFVRPLLKLVTLSGHFDLQGIDCGVNLSSRLTTKLSFLVGWEELQVVDGAVNGLSELIQKWGAQLRRLQTGQVQHYLYSVVLGVFVLYVIMLLI